MKVKKFFIILLILLAIESRTFAQDIYDSSYNTLQKMKSIDYEDAMTKAIFSNPEKRNINIIKGYHDSDDKSEFWIPKNVNPLMMSNTELEKYRIIKNTEPYKNDFYKHYMLKAKQENRPFLPIDVQLAEADQKALYGGIVGGGIIQSLRDTNGKLGQLSEEEEKTLKRLQYEYGKDNAIFKDEELQRLLKLYRQRQEYIKNNSQNLTEKEQEFQKSEQNKIINHTKEPYFEPYMKELQRRIKMNWDSPNENKRVVLLFKIEKDGKLSDVKVQTSSGIPKVDNAAINAVKMTQPFRPLPPEYKGKSVDILFTFN